MPRSMWTGAISFGLVNIPVRLFTAVSPKDVHFHMLHDKDGVRIRQKRVCPADDEEVSFDHIVKGYEVAKDQYVIIAPKELEALDPKATHAVDIESFVDLDEIDPIFYESTYYLLPDRGAAKSYVLLLEALERTNKVAIARVVLRTKQYLCAVRPHGRVLALSTMYFHDEVIAESELDGVPTRSDVKLHEKELAMAEQLVESLTSTFDATQYEDEYRARVLELIERKSQGQEIASAPPREHKAKVVDLVTALQQSLANAKARGAAKGHANRDASDETSDAADPEASAADSDEATGKEATRGHKRPNAKVAEAHAPARTRTRRNSA